MRERAIPAVVVASVLILLSGSPVVASSEPARVTEFGYTWGDNEILGAKVWTYIGTNLTMDVSHVLANGSSIGDVALFTLHVTAPAGDPYPPSNGTNPFPYPQISAVYDSSALGQHQVLEMRFLRLVEFQDSNGDGAYAAGDPVDSEFDLSNLSMRYSPVLVTGLTGASNFQSLPVRDHYPNVCCGESWDGWLSENDSSFASFAGLYFQVAATARFNFSVSAYQWFAPQSFQGVNVTPTSVKLDFRIEDYPYASPSSRLALEVNLTSFSQGSDTGWTQTPWPEGEGLDSSAGNTSAFFAWSGNASADGVLRPVVSSVIPVDLYTRDLYLSYPHAAYIAHDPVLGIADHRLASIPSIPGSLGPALWNLTWIAFIATLAAGAIALFAVERRKV